MATGVTRRALRALLLASLALLLTGCENDAASYQIQGSMDNALTLIREQRWFWDKTSEVHLVVARYPECQRRHTLNSMPVGDPGAEVYQTGPQRYLFKNGQSWYDVDQRSCELQAVSSPADNARGARVGAFVRQDGKLRFVPAAPV